MWYGAWGVYCTLYSVQSPIGKVVRRTVSTYLCTPYVCMCTVLCMYLFVLGLGGMGDDDASESGNTPYRYSVMTMVMAMLVPGPKKVSLTDKKWVEKLCGYFLP